jgi:hypothetical protein
MTARWLVGLHHGETRAGRPPFGYGERAERAVWEALRDQLPALPTSCGEVLEVVRPG